jgi:TolB-like protein
MNIIKKLIIFSLVINPQILLAGDSLDKLSSKLQNGIKKYSSMKIAVMEFPYTDGRKSEGSVIIQERLTTSLAQNKKITLIERSLLNKVLGELNLQSSGAIDEETTKKLGKILGADAIVTGTLNDIKNDKVEINARIVQTETAKILSAGKTAVEKTWKDTTVITHPVQPPDYSRKPLVQIAVLLDTSNSMDGLINQARTQLWKIVNELVSSEKDGSKPMIEVALYEYGKTSLPADKGYLRQVLPFTMDLDKIGKELFALTTNGGDEYAGWVIKDATNNLKWSKAGDVYKAIFIAGNEPFTQGTVDFRQSIAQAKSKGIFVNTIYCGSRQQGIAEQWKTGSEIAEGDYTNIDQEASVAQIATPHDDKITEMTMEMDKTHIAYGDAGKKALEEKEEMDSVVMSAGKGFAAERASFQAASPQVFSSWDIVSAVESGQTKVEEIKKENLPKDMQGMKKEEIEKTINQKLLERKKIRDEINRLQEERKKYIEMKEKQTSGKPSTFDKAMIDSIRKQASKKGFKFK